jgi:hypothetical protein
MLSSLYANSLRSRPDLQQVALRKVIKGKTLEEIMNHVELAALSNRDILLALDTERARINDRTAHWGDPTVQPHHLPMRPPSPRQIASIAPLAPLPLSPEPSREGQKQSGNTDTLLQDLISQMQTLTLHIRGVPPQTYCTKCQSREHNAGTCPTNGYQYKGPYSFGYPPPPQPNAYYPHQSQYYPYQDNRDYPQENRYYEGGRRNNYRGRDNYQRNQNQQQDRREENPNPATGANAVPLGAQPNAGPTNITYDHGCEETSQHWGDVCGNLFDFCEDTSQNVDGPVLTAPGKRIRVDELVNTMPERPRAVPYRVHQPSFPLNEPTPTPTRVQQANIQTPAPSHPKRKKKKKTTMTSLTHSFWNSPAPVTYQQLFQLKPQLFKSFHSDLARESRHLAGTLVTHNLHNKQCTTPV